MNLKIDIIDRTVIFYNGDEVFAEFKDVSNLEINNFRRIQYSGAILAWATSHYYGLVTGIICSNGGISKQSYGYAVKDGEVMRVEGGDGGAERL